MSAKKPVVKEPKVKAKAKTTKESPKAKVKAKAKSKEPVKEVKKKAPVKGVAGLIELKAVGKRFFVTIKGKVTEKGFKDEAEKKEIKEFIEGIAAKPTSANIKKLEEFLSPKAKAKEKAVEKEKETLKTEKKVIKRNEDTEDYKAGLAKLQVWLNRCQNSTSVIRLNGRASDQYSEYGRFKQLLAECAKIPGLNTITADLDKRYKGEY